MFIDQLRMAVASQQDTKVVEPSNDALQLDAVHQEDGQRDFIFADFVEEAVLQPLLALGWHLGEIRLFLFALFWVIGVFDYGTDVLAAVMPSRRSQYIRQRNAHSTNSSTC